MTLKNIAIPKALANDNFIGYMHDVFVYHSVNWIEATIALPVYCGLITYYIEGDPSERHHMKESTYAHPERAYGVRGLTTARQRGHGGDDREFSAICIDQ